MMTGGSNAPTRLTGDDAMARRALVLAPLILLLARPASGSGTPPRREPRELVAGAEAVVRAEAAGPGAPRRFRVLEVLLGGGLRPGEEVAPDFRADYELAGHAAGALLFLRREGPAWVLVPGGLRLADADGTVLEAVKSGTAGPYQMVPRPGLRWDELLRQVRADCGAVRRLHEAASLPRAAVRNAALLAWAEEHRREFGTAAGWGPLERDVFQWVLAGGRPEDSWAAVRLYAEVHAGRVPALRVPAFGTPGARDLLLRQAEGYALEGDRARALALLALPETLWPEPAGRGVGEADEREQEEIAGRLVTLLKAKESAVRAGAARALRAVLLQPGHPPGPVAARTLPALEQAYKAEAPGLARDELAAAVYSLARPGRWQELTGNAHALFARLQDPERDHGKVVFWLQLRSDGVRVHECPGARLERLDKGKVVEKKETALEVVNPPASWQEGWPGEPLLMCQFPLQGLKPGTWRLTVRGRAGKGKDAAAWTAEPRTFTLEQPRAGEGDVISGGFVDR
jgi:hypothetical protein